MPFDDLITNRISSGNIAANRLGQWLESEAAGLTATLHAFLMIDIGSHQPTDEADIEFADLDIVPRKVMIHAVLALDARKPVAFLGIYDSSCKSGLVHDLDDLRDALNAGLSAKAGNGRGRHVDTKVEHVSSEFARPDFRPQLFEKDAGEPRVFLWEAVDASIGQHIEAAGAATRLARRTPLDITVSLQPGEVLLDRAPADFEAYRYLIDRETRFTI